MDLPQFVVNSKTIASLQLSCTKHSGTATTTTSLLLSVYYVYSYCFILLQYPQQNSHSYKAPTARKLMPQEKYKHLQFGANSFF